MKKLIIILGLLVSLFFLGIERLNYLSQKEIKLDNFSTFNKVEIYTAYILMNVLGYPLYPEISKEAMLMLNPNVRNKEIHFETDFFLDSKVVQKAIKNYKKPYRLTWTVDNYVIGSPEARVSLTLNSVYFL